MNGFEVGVEGVSQFLEFLAEPLLAILGSLAVPLGVAAGIILAVLYVDDRVPLVEIVGLGTAMSIGLWIFSLPVVIASVVMSVYGIVPGLIVQGLAILLYGVLAVWAEEEESLSEDEHEPEESSVSDGTLTDRCPADVSSHAHPEDSADKHWQVLIDDVEERTKEYHAAYEVKQVRQRVYECVWCGREYETEDVVEQEMVTATDDFESVDKAGDAA